MVTAELKSLHSPDLSQSRGPDDPDAAAVLIEAAIGPQGHDGGDVFSFVAITPRALARDHGPRWGRGYLIPDPISWPAVQAAVRNLLSHASDDNWRQVAESLNREMHWEIENYRE